MRHPRRNLLMMTTVVDCILEARGNQPGEYNLIWALGHQRSERSVARNDCRVYEVVSLSPKTGLHCPLAWRWASRTVIVCMYDMTFMRGCKRTVIQNGYV